MLRHLCHKILRGEQSSPRAQLSRHYVSLSRVLHGAVQGKEAESASRLHKSESIYMHHATLGSSINSAAVTLGVIHSLSVLRPGLGYFRPIDSTTHGGDRTKLVKEVYGLPGPLEDMKGCSQVEAYRYLASDNTDDLIETILKAYEQYKARHDFVVVEGSSLKDGFNAAPLNAAIAAALGCPALLLADVRAAAAPLVLSGSGGSAGARNIAAVDWQQEVAQALQDHARVLRRGSVDVVGSLVYTVPPPPVAPAADATEAQQVAAQGGGVLPEQHLPLKQKLQAAGMALVGCLPQDAVLEALEVQDIQRALGAEVLYGTGAPHVAGDAMSTEVMQHIVCTMQTADLLAYIPTHTRPSEGAVVISHHTRPDVLMACIDLHDSQLASNVAAVVLTGGRPPTDAINNLILNRRQATTLPVLLAPEPTYESCIALSRAQPTLQRTSTRKIERAQILFEEHADVGLLKEILFKEREVKLNPKLFQYNLFKKARSSRQHIVLPEGDEERTLQAAAELMRRSLCHVTLLGKREKVLLAAKQLHVDLCGAAVVDPAESPHLERYAQLLHDLRKHKGMTMEQARDMMLQDVNYYGTAMVATGDADGMVSGAVHTTANTVRPALQIIKTLPGVPIVSSVFFMCLHDKVLAYADCAINTDPTSEELAVIAECSADTARAFGVEPRVALLSYATGDSNQGPLIKKVSDAVKIAQARRPELLLEGPLQYDAAVNPETARTKLKGGGSAVAGKATVLVFPDLNTGNNTYKAVQQSTGAVAMGPVLQGLRKPVNDLSRGCTVKDIVTTVAITALQAISLKEAQGKGPMAGA